MKFWDWFDEDINVTIPRGIAILGIALFVKAGIDTLFWILSWVF